MLQRTGVPLRLARPERLYLSRGSGQPWRLTLTAAIIPVTPFQQNSALIWDQDTKRGVVIDPGGDAARASLSRDIDRFYNACWPHLSLERQTPDKAYFTARPSIPMAA